MGLQKIFGLIHENGKEGKSEKIFCAQNRFFYILYEKRKEVSHMKNKTFILLVAVVCLISVTLAACAGCASEQGEAEVTTPQSTETTRSTPYFGVFEAERGNSFYIDIGGVPLDVIGDGGKTATKFQMEYSVEDEQVAEIVAIEEKQNLYEGEIYRHYAFDCQNLRWADSVCQNFRSPYSANDHNRMHGRIKFLPIIKFLPAFWGRRRHQERVALVALRRARKSLPRRFPFFDSFFSFAPVYAKEKADEEFNILFSAVCDT